MAVQPAGSLFPVKKGEVVVPAVCEQGLQERFSPRNWEVHKSVLVFFVTLVSCD